MQINLDFTKQEPDNKELEGFAAVEQVDAIIKATVDLLGDEDNSDLDNEYLQGKKDGLRIALAILMPHTREAKSAALSQLSVKFTKYTHPDEERLVQKATL